MKTDDQLINEKYTDIKSPLGLVYEKVQKDFFRKYKFGRIIFLFPRCSSRLKILVQSKKIELDIFNVLICSSNTSFEILPTTQSISEWAILLPSLSLVEEVIEQYKISKSVVNQMEAGFYLLKRENWLNELMHRYVYERVVANANNNLATKFLSSEVVKEILFLLKNSETLTSIKIKNRVNLSNINIEQKSDVLKKAISYIDSQLYSLLTVTSIAQAIGTSASTLLRVFNLEMEKSPIAYVRDRRLEEACVMLRSGSSNVNDVAAKSGYETPAAFIASFKKKYGLTPSKLIPNKKS